MFIHFFFVVKIMFATTIWKSGQLFSFPVLFVLVLLVQDRLLKCRAKCVLLTKQTQESRKALHDQVILEAVLPRVLQAALGNTSLQSLFLLILHSIISCVCVIDDSLFIH